MKFVFAFNLFYLTFSICTLNAQVRIYEGTEIIPTYKLGESLKSPLFYTGRSIQGAQGKIYPYAAQTNLGRKLEEVTYKMLYLENEYIKVKVLPQFGGRLFSAIDKTNDHELFHTNSVIKPDLIGTLGAWVSGGIEWCFPHHHRTTTMLSSDYRLVENKDGSATIWIGETEKTIRARGVIGMTLHPGKSYIEVDYRLNNTSSKTKSFLFWANVAVTANNEFRTFWPPSQEIGVYHNNRDFIRWPLSNATDKYASTSYVEGVDLTWWKNHPNPVSFFMWDIKEGFIGGYDYGAHAGMVHVGDPNKNSASKLWQFGPGLVGQNARRKLTDDGKAYVELMTGTFSNNQPDYSWSLPHSVKWAKNYWYPIRDLEVVKNANIDASLTLQMRDERTIFFGFNTTQKIANATYFLTHNGNIIETDTIEIDPALPFTKTFYAEELINEYDLHLKIIDNAGKEIISYTPYRPLKPELPKPQTPVMSPEEIESVEDLYLTGRFVEQFNRPGKNPDDYYLAALKKSPFDYRANIAIAKRRVNQTRYKEALAYLQKASKKLNIKYYQPLEGELFYYKGLSFNGLGKTKEAYANFARASWYYKWFSASNFQLALIEGSKGDFEKALEYCKEAYSTNTRDGRISVLYSALLRKMDNKNKAHEIIEEYLSFDPLSFAGIYERGMLQKKNLLKTVQSNMQDVDNNLIEIATNYLNAGLYNDGINVLESIENPQNPLVLYYLAWFYEKINQHTKRNDCLRKAKKLSLDYSFPYREETEKVLDFVIKAQPNNADAYYLLGNLLYDNRKSEAMNLWKTAGSLDKNNAMVWRNLAFGYYHHKKDIDTAISHISKAISLNNNVPLWYAELFKYYDVSDKPYKECLDILEQNIEKVKKDIQAPKALVALYNLDGSYDKALQFLTSHKFRTWEGGRETYWSYVDANVLKALELSNGGEYDQALTYLNDAMKYPENLEVGKPTHDEKNAMIYFFIGEVFSKMKDNVKANEAYKKSVQAKNSKQGMYELRYFQAASLKKLGELDKANEIFNAIIEHAKDQRKAGLEITLIAVEENSVTTNKALSDSYYLEALGNNGLGNHSHATKLYKMALSEYQNNLWAKILMDY